MGGSVQEQMGRVAEEIERIKEEISGLKIRLQQKRDEMKTLKKLSDHPSSQSQEGESQPDDQVIDLRPNELDRLLLYHQLKPEKHRFRANLPRLQAFPILFGGQDIFPSNTRMRVSTKRPQQTAFQSFFSSSDLTKANSEDGEKREKRTFLKSHSSHLNKQTSPQAPDPRYGGKLRSILSLSPRLKSSNNLPEDHEFPQSARAPSPLKKRISKSLSRGIIDIPRSPPKNTLPESTEGPIIPARNHRHSPKRQSSSPKLSSRGLSPVRIRRPNSPRTRTSRNTEDSRHASPEMEEEGDDELIIVEPPSRCDELSEVSLPAGAAVSFALASETGSEEGTDHGIDTESTDAFDSPAPTEDHESDEDEYDDEDEDDESEDESGVAEDPAVSYLLYANALGEEESGKESELNASIKVEVEEEDCIPSPVEYAGPTPYLLFEPDSEERESSSWSQVSYSLAQSGEEKGEGDRVGKEAEDDGPVNYSLDFGASDARSDAEAVNYSLSVEEEEQTGGERDNDAVNYSLSVEEEQAGSERDNEAVNYSLSVEEEEQAGGERDNEAVNYSLNVEEDEQTGGKRDNEAVNYSLGSVGEEGQMGAEKEDAEVNYSLCQEEEDPIQRPRSDQLRSKDGTTPKPTFQGGQSTEFRVSPSPNQSPQKSWLSQGRSKDEVKRAPPVPSFSEIHRNTSPRNNNNNSSSFVKAGGMSASGAMEMYHQHFLQESRRSSRVPRRVNSIMKSPSPVNATPKFGVIDFRSNAGSPVREINTTRENTEKNIKCENRLESFTQSEPSSSLHKGGGTPKIALGGVRSKNKVIIKFKKPNEDPGERLRKEREDALASVDKSLASGGQWSERFQLCLERLRNLDDSSEHEDKVKANKELMYLSEDFVSASRAVGKIIISEVYLPFEDKVIKPTVGLGGRAGGEKYMVHNILFKFALDAFGLFGGSDLSAAKVSGHELKGLMAYFSLEMEEVNFPLMTLVDYRGFRLVAISVLPVGKGTLIYGTCDGGASYFNSDRVFSNMMTQAGKKLNLKDHFCGTSQRNAVKLSAAADIEGHRGFDGKFYLLDFSRTMPPVMPKPDKYYNGHLFYLFRREFVRTNPKPLCSDAYSGFITGDRNAKYHNIEIDEATQQLHKQVIPQYARSLYQAAESGVLSHLDVTAHFHRTGINVRYIGTVIIELDQMITKGEGEEKILTSIIALLLTEAVARVVKNDINLQMRQKTWELQLPLEVPYRKLAVDYMNMVFGRGKCSENWWHHTLPPLLTHYFNVEMSNREAELRQFLLTGRGIEDGRVALFRRILALTGLVFSENITKKLSDRSVWMSEPVDYLDLIEMGERVKCMDIVSLSQGNFFLYKALGMSDAKVKMALLLQAMNKYEEALNSNTNVETLMNCSIAFYNFLLIKGGEKGSGANEDSFERTDPGVQKLEGYLQRLVTMDQRAKSFCLYALFLVRCQDYVKAEKFFIRSIQTMASPHALTEYLYFLDRCNLSFFAEHTYRCIVEKTNQRIVSPYNGKELGGIVKIFSQNGSFKSLKIRAITSSMDVLVMIAHFAKTQFDHLGFQLVAVNPGSTSLKQVTEESWKVIDEWAKIVEGATKKEIFRPCDLPWIYLQRPNSPYFLFLQKISSPCSPEALSSHLLLPYQGYTGSWKKRDFVLELLSQDCDRIYPLLLISPLIMEKSDLRDLLIRNMSNARVPQIMALWSFSFEDVKDSDFETFLQTVKLPASRDGFAFGQVRQRTLDETDAYLACLRKAVKWGPSNKKKKLTKELSLSTLLSLPPVKLMKKTDPNTKPRQPRLLLRSFDQEEIERVAQIFRYWSYFVQFPVKQRDFLTLSIGDEPQIPTNLRMVLLYEYSITKWVLNEVLGLDQSPQEALKSFSCFVDLAIYSCRLGDLSTSIAIIDALNSNRVHQAQLGWSVLSNHRAIRCKFESSVPYLHFAVSSATKTVEYLQFYDDAIQYLNGNSEEGVYMLSFHRICSYLTSVGSIFDHQSSSSSSSSSSSPLTTSTSNPSFPSPPSPSLSANSSPLMGMGHLLNESRATAVGDMIVKYGIRGLKKGSGMCVSLFEEFVREVGGKGKKGKAKGREKEKEREKGKEKKEKEEEKQNHKAKGKRLEGVIHKKLSMGILTAVARHFEGEEMLRASISSPPSLPTFMGEDEDGETFYKPKKHSFDARRTGSLMLGGDFRRHSGARGGSGGNLKGSGETSGRGGGNSEGSLTTQSPKRSNLRIASPKKQRRGEGEEGRGASPGKRRGVWRQLSLKGEELEVGRGQLPASFDKERASGSDRDREM